jgi:hypothetical protein
MKKVAPARTVPVESEGRMAEAIAVSMRRREERLRRSPV